MEDKVLFNLYSQYHGCWYPGDIRSQGMSSHGIDPVSSKWFRSHMVGVNKMQVIQVIKKIDYSSSNDTYKINILLRLQGFLTHWGIVTDICVSRLTIIGSDNGLAPSRPPSHYLNQCWLIANWTPGNKFQWIWIEILSFSFKKMHLQMLSAQMAAILSRGKWVNCNMLRYGLVSWVIINTST